jgi:Na+-driven multidrug efflux pump
LLTSTVGLACLVPLGRQVFLLYAAAGGASVNLALQFTLVPRLGATGAAWAVAAAEGCVLLVQLSALVGARRRVVRADSVGDDQGDTGAHHLNARGEQAAT